MAYYALGTRPIINKLHATCNVAQVWYADDSSSCGTLEEIKVVGNIMYNR